MLKIDIAKFQQTEIEKCEVVEIYLYPLDL